VTNYNKQHSDRFMVKQQQMSTGNAWQQQQHVTVVGRRQDNDDSQLRSITIGTIFGTGHRNG